MATHRETAALSSGAQRAPDWTEAHEALSRLARRRAKLDAEEGPWLLCASRIAVHEHLGCGSFVEYVERFFGYKPRTTQEKLRVAEALEGLPRLRGALACGVLGWCAIRELTRVAVPDTEEAWLDAARSKTLRELEALVADKSPGDAPDAPGDRAPRRHVLRFEVAADTFATFRDAMQRLERTAGGRMGHDALLLAMARQVLGGPTDDGRSSYQISLHVCSECGRGDQVASGELVAVEPAVVEMAECDAQHLGHLGACGMPERAANENADPTGQGARQPAGANANDVDASTAGRCSSHAHTCAAKHVRDDAPSTPAATAPAATSTPRARQPASANDTDVDASAAGPCSSQVSMGAASDIQSNTQNDVGQHLGHLGQERTANENAAPPSQGARQSAGANENDVAASAAGRCSSRVHTGAASDVQRNSRNDTQNDASSTTGAAAPIATAPAVASSPSTSVAPAPTVPAVRRRLPRARQSIPPALRRAVLERDRHRCQVPGCTHSKYVDVHHIQRRADGGLNVIGNLLTLCSAHHRATHRGELHIERGSTGAIVFRHADGSPYGQPPSPERIDAHTKVFSALRNLGFRELAVKAVLAELRADPALADATVQQLLREALCRIQPAR